MEHRDIVVVGASAGGVEALTAFVKGLPAGLDASVFVVLHVPPYSPSGLPQILSDAGPLKARHAIDDEQIERGQIYVAPPDHHLLIENDRTLVRRGPKENRFRPSVDALFRSAANQYGSRVIGIVLSGALDDGTSGLWSIQRLGGTTIVQEPADARQSAMPQNAMESVEIDHVCKSDQMGALVARLCSEEITVTQRVSQEELKRLALEVEIAIRDNAFQQGIMKWGDLTPFTCPECQGALVKVSEGNLSRFRCHTGHAFSTSALLAGITEAVEDLMWQTMRGLEETTMLLEEMAERFAKSEDSKTAQLFMEKANESRAQARVIHDSLPRHQHLSKDLQFERRHIGK